MSVSMCNACKLFNKDLNYCAFSVYIGDICPNFTPNWEDNMNIPKPNKRPPMPKIKMSRWLPPLMGEGAYGIRCEMCWGSIMRNAEGAFVKTPFCPHCGKKMSNPD